MHLLLTAEQLRIVRAILHDQVPMHQTFAFGSRVSSGTDGAAAYAVKPHSDLDIALQGPALNPADMFELRDAFSNSELPFRVDLSMRHDLPPTWFESLRMYPLTQGEAA